MTNKKLNFSEQPGTHKTTADTTSFNRTLQEYRQCIDADIAVYAKHVSSTMYIQYGERGADIGSVFLDILNRGGKRIRGALVMAGYEMCGGTDKAMIVRAATALEMIHAYILIIDDIQDRSPLRRGKPSAHEMLKTYSTEQGLQGDASHTGMGLALNAALIGAHAAQMLLAGLQVDPELRLKVIGIANHTMVVTAHGQTYDMVNALSEEVSAEDLERVLLWKTAEYTFLNPLCVGMALAGAECDATDAIRDYALEAGQAFQITDDIIGMFGSSATTGKDCMDDMREGKRTILTTHALKHVSAADRAFLRTSLGNAALTLEEFKRCQDIIRGSGALEYAESTAKAHVARAITALDESKGLWSDAGSHFLTGLAESLLSRSS